LFGRNHLKRPDHARHPLHPDHHHPRRDRRRRHGLYRRQPDPRRKSATALRDRNGVTAKGGQAPAFDVETGSVSIGTKNTMVKVPALIVHKPGANEAEANAGNAM